MKTVLFSNEGIFFTDKEESIRFVPWDHIEQQPKISFTLLTTNVPDVNCNIKYERYTYVIQEVLIGQTIFEYDNLQITKPILITEEHIGYTLSVVKRSDTDPLTYRWDANLYKPVILQADWFPYNKTAIDISYLFRELSFHSLYSDIKP